MPLRFISGVNQSVPLTCGNLLTTYIRNKFVSSTRGNEECDRSNDVSKRNITIIDSTLCNKHNHFFSKTSSFMKQSNKSNMEQEPIQVTWFLSFPCSVLEIIVCTFLPVYCLSFFDLPVCYHHIVYLVFSVRWSADENILFNSPFAIVNCQTRLWWLPLNTQCLMSNWFYTRLIQKYKRSLKIPKG